jgi:mannose/fructose-specific phosphotransferase system component IIA
MAEKVRAVVAAHGTLSEGLVSAVGLISGRAGSLRAMSNEGLAAADVTAAIAKALDETGASVVFTDLPAGSCTLAARRLLRERPSLSVVTGVNLPMLLEFVMRDAAVAPNVAEAAERGREHIRVLVASDVG